MLTIRQRRADRLIRKHLAWQDMKLMKSRSNAEKSNLGDLYIVTTSNALVYSHQSIEGLRDEAELIEDMIQKLRLHGRKCATEEGLPFKLTPEDVFMVFNDHVWDNKTYLTPQTLQHYERLLFGAVVACNRDIAQRRVTNVWDAICNLKARRSEALAKMASA